MLLKDFTAKVAADHAKLLKGINAASLVVIYNGKKLKNPDKTLKQQSGGKEPAKLMVTNCGAIMKDSVGHALRSMGHAVTETQMEDFLERAEMGADLSMMQAFINEISEAPIGQQAIDDMEEVLAKEGHYKFATIEKIFKALDETNLSPEELTMIMQAADPSGSGQIPKDFFQKMI